MKILDKLFQIATVGFSAFMAYKFLMAYHAPEWFAVAFGGGLFVISMLLHSLIDELVEIRRKLNQKTEQ
ncbi:hypothetical protein FAES_1842 [Fibrella aestuarina BUZ 2]|uniref:Uncharacterized protein n=1 Tax=Fibrella aestuarina BUZ 2 TaxID=1166018 RepID=I0K6U9_9BACT|nr:hypothetical protein [Fibrella aestuarina]CCG99852.1 hypothetical protein FAES_1842 [Fibrella aestuarina BUZ 2]